jgi:hypothetical protein
VGVVTDWASLQHAYGNAENLPKLIYSWLHETTEENRPDLWGHLCHQGTVYSASFEAIPLLADSALQLRPAVLREVLFLIGAIWVSEDRFDGAFPRPELYLLLSKLEALTLGAMGNSHMSQSEFLGLLMTFAALKSDKYWFQQLDHIGDDELHLTCTSCNRDIEVEMGDIATARKSLRQPDENGNKVTPADVETLSPVAQSLIRLAEQHGHHSLSRGMLFSQGKLNCPWCNLEINVRNAFMHSQTVLARGVSKIL